MACGDEMPPVEPPPPVKGMVFDLQWATILDAEKELVSTDNTQQYRDWVLVGGDIGDPPTVKAFNKVTGVEDWEFIHSGMVSSKILASALHNNLYVGLCSDGLICFNIDSKAVVWEIDYNLYDFSIGGKVLNIYQDYFYIDVSKGGVGLDSKSAAIIKIHLQTGEFEEVYESINDEEGLKTLSSIAIKSIDNSTIIYFNERPNAETPPQDTRQVIVAYNVDNKTVVWKSNVTDGFASNGLHPPIIYEDLVITGGDWSIYAFDIHTGEQKWKTEIAIETPFASWGTTNHLIQDDRLYVNETGRHITCLNPLTGDIIWDSMDAPNCTDNMLYYEKEDYLVFASWGYGSVMILDALTGETVHREHRYDESQYNNDVVYDAELDMFFTSTYKHAVGFKINPPE